MGGASMSSCCQSVCDEMTATICEEELKYDELDNWKPGNNVDQSASSTQQQNTACRTEAFNTNILHSDMHNVSHTATGFRVAGVIFRQINSLMLVLFSTLQLVFSDNII